MAMWKRAWDWFEEVIWPTIAPWAISLFFCLLTGYDFKVDKSIPEVLMITAAVATSAMYSEVTIESKIKNGELKTKKILKIQLEDLVYIFKKISNLSKYFSWLLYISLFNTWGNVSTFFLAKITEKVKIGLYILVFLLFFLNAIMALCMEMQGWEQEKENEQKQKEANQVSNSNIDRKDN